MKGYTKIPNDILYPSQLSIPARYIYCLLLRHCGADDSCFPSQRILAETMGLSDRQIRNLLKELLESKIITKKRSGWNRSNTYYVSKSLMASRNGLSYHLGSAHPLPHGNQFPNNNTYIKGKGKRSLKGLEKMRKELIKKRIMK